MRTMLNRLVLAPAPMGTMLNGLGSSCGPAELCLRRAESLLSGKHLNKNSARFKHSSAGPQLEPSLLSMVLIGAGARTSRLNRVLMAEPSIILC